STGIGPSSQSEAPESFGFFSGYSSEKKARTHQATLPRARNRSLQIKWNPRKIRLISAYLRPRYECHTGRSSSQVLSLGPAALVLRHTGLLRSCRHGCRHSSTSPVATG